MPTKTELRLIRQWEERLVEDYYDYRCQQLLEPLYEEFQQWKEGALSHETMFDAIQRVHRENRERYNYFARNRTELARWVQLDPWFDQWLQAHPAPEGVELISETAKQDMRALSESGRQASADPASSTGASRDSGKESG